MPNWKVARHTLTISLVGAACPVGKEPCSGMPSSGYVFYNIFSQLGGTAHAIAIVEEQLRAIRNSSFWPVDEIRFATIGDPELRGKVERVCDEIGANCTHLGHTKRGSETRTLEPLRAFCTAHPDATVAYIHDKGSYHAVLNERGRSSNTVFRRGLMRGVFSSACVDAITRGVRCDICGMRFSPAPHAHMPGNMFLARCDYIAKLLPLPHFEQRMNAHYQGEKKTCDWCVGSGRFASEHWVGAHPSIRPCDVLDSKYAWAYHNLPDHKTYPIRFAMAPRYRNGHPYRNEEMKRTVAHALAEWWSIYNEAPPASSLLLRYYAESR